MKSNTEPKSKGKSLKSMKVEEMTENQKAAIQAYKNVKEKAQEDRTNKTKPNLDIKKHPDIVFKAINLVQQRRKELSISQVQLSKLSGVDQAYKSRIERGIRPNCSFGMIEKLFKALNIKWSELDEV